MKENFIKNFLLVLITLFVVISFILGLSIGAGSQKSVFFSNDVLSGWIASISTLAIALLTLILALETFRLRKIQQTQIDKLHKDSIKPVIGFNLESITDIPSCLNFHIKNNGKGVAQCINFCLVNRSTDTGDIHNYLQNKFNELSILSNGISCLGIGDDKTSFLFDMNKLIDEFGEEKVFKYQAKIDITFQDIEGTPYTSFSHITPRDFQGITVKSTKSPLRTISESLTKLLDILEKDKNTNYQDISDKEASESWKRAAQKPSPPP